MEPKNLLERLERMIHIAHETNCILTKIATPDAEKILELLKAQEPRVMTLEELKNNVDNPCWFESHGTYMGYEGFWIIPYAFTAWNTMYYVFPLMQINERGDSHYSELGLSAYNKAWRCWSSRPTDEQRKAVEWE